MTKLKSFACALLTLGLFAVPTFAAQPRLSNPPGLAVCTAMPSATAAKVMGLPKVNIDNGPSEHTYLPAFEDAVSIQSAISEVCEMMLHRRIEAKEASILLYAMQVASTNMAQLNGQKSQRKQKNQKTGSPNNPSSAPLTQAPPANDTVSSEPLRLPPGTIQACAPRRQASK
jgi:hypothetical protein